MNRLTRLALERPSITVLVTFFLLVGGIFAARDLNQELVPQVEFPQATVVTVWPGASADEVTHSVVEPIESALERITDVPVVEVSSSASESFAATTVRTEYGTTQDELRDAIEAELKDVTLPDDAQDPQVVLFSFSDLPVVQTSVRGADGDLDTADLQRIVKDQVLDELEGIEGVSSVALAGGREEKVFIDIDPIRLAQKDQSLGAIKGALQANDLSFPAGSLEVGGKAIPLQVVHRLSSEADLADLALGNGKGGPPASGGPAAPAPSASGPAAGSPATSAARPTAATSRDSSALPVGTARVKVSTPTDAPTAARASARRSTTLLAIKLPAEAAALGYATTRDLTPDAVRTLQAARPDLLQQIAEEVIGQVPPGGPSPVSAAVLEALPADIRRRLQEILDAAADSGPDATVEPTAKPRAALSAPTAVSAAADEAAARAATTAGLLAGSPALLAGLDPATLASMVESAPQLLNQLDPATVDQLLQAAPELLGQIDPQVLSELLAARPELVADLDPATVDAALAAAPRLLGQLDSAAINALLVGAPDLVGRLDPAVVDTIPVAVLRQIPDAVLAGLPVDLRAAVMRRMGGAQVPRTGGRRLLQAAGGATRLGDVAEINRELEPAATLNRTDGDPSLSLIIFKDQSANTVSVVDEVLAKLKDLETSGDLDEDLKFNVVFEQGTFIKDSLKGVRNEGILGGIFAILVILIFLNFSVRSTLVTAISIPISIVVALLLMRVQGLTLNIMSLAGLTIAIGRVVDDAIVVIENIYRHIQAGEPVREAVVNGTREVSTAITAATLVTVAVFLPLGLVGGITSEFFKPFAFTASYALLASLLVALTVVPLVARRLLRRDNLPEDHEGWLLRVYTPVLRWALDHRFLTLLLALLFFAGSLSLLGLVDKTFLPSFGEPAIQVEMSLPPGTDLASTDDVSQKVEDLLMDWDGIDTVETTVGRGSQFFGQFSGGDSARAFFYASIDKAEAAGTKDADAADADGGADSGGLLQEWFAPKVDAQALAADLRDELDNLRGDLVDDGLIADEEDLTFTVTAGAGGGPQGSRYDLQVKSDDEAALRDANDLIMEALEDEDNWTENPKFTEVPIINLSSNLSEARSVVQVQVDPAKAVAKGLSTIQVGVALREMIEGADLGDLELVDGDKTETLEVFARYPSDLVKDVEGLKRLPISGSQGPVPLEQVATITEGPGPVQITRIDGERAVVLSGEITTQDTFGVLDQADKIVKQVVEDEGLDEDVTVGAGAESRQQRDGFRDMLIALPISILIVYLIMVLTFGSLVHPFTILFSLPFAVSGALMALAVTGRAISMSSLIGMMMLIGIVTTNAIVLVDLVQQYRAQGMDARTALLEGGRHRLRPIVMTAIATIIALIPQAIGFTEGALIASELATTVIGGLLASTVLTLVIVPVIYSLLDRLTGGDVNDRPLPPGEGERGPTPTQPMAETAIVAGADDPGAGNPAPGLTADAPAPPPAPAAAIDPRAAEETPIL